MTHEIKKRLQKLEKQIPQRPTAETKINGVLRFLVLAVAYYLGDPQPDEAPMSAFMRALSYPDSYRFENALNNLPDFNEKYAPPFLNY